MSESVPLRACVSSYIGGGWGEEQASEEFGVPAFVIRGTDFEACRAGNPSNVPYRFHKSSNAEKRLLNPGDICLEGAGGSDDQPVGRVLLIDDYLLAKLSGPVICASFCKLLRPNLNQVNPTYLFWVLQAAYQSSLVEKYQVQSTGIRNFQLEYFLDDFQVPLPAIAVQQSIGVLLTRFENLYRNNRRRIELLEETARLLYREWFVNFRYPGHEEVPLVDSELGPVPEGWGTTSLDQRACLTRSSITPGDYPSEMFDHFSLPAFDKKSEPAVESGESIKSNKYLVDGECVLWSKINPRFPRIWWAAPFITERRSVASTEFLVLTVNGGWRLPFIYSLVSSELFSLTMAARANGTSNSHQRVAPSDVMTYPILDPEDSIQERFSDLVEPFLQLKSELIIQNRSLAQTRDLLLPHLVSGDLDVSDLELDLEAVS